MIPILYTSSERNFDTNGIGKLSDIVDIHVEPELNRTYELEMKYPVAGIHFADIVHRAIILSSVDPVSDPQPFRIYRITKPSKGIVTVYARHAAYYDLPGVTVSPFSAASAAEALVNMKANAVVECPFMFWTDKTTSAEFNSKTPKSVWALLGGSAGSILDTYGGEYEFDRWAVKLHTRRGADRGVSIRYGKNLQSLEQDENCANCYTGVEPFWINQDGSEYVELPEKILYAEGDFGYTRIYPLDLSSEWSEAPTEEQLRSYAAQYMKTNNIGIPAVSIKVEFVPLAQTEEYKDIAILEQVLMGDTVHVYFPELNVNASARVVKYRWKPLLDRYDSVTIGRVKSNIAKTIVQQNQQIAEKATPSMMQNIAQSLATAITGARGGVVRLLDTNGDGAPDELYIADNADPAQAVYVWRFNYMGLAASENGYNGPFIMGATFEDGILAHMIKAVQVTAGTIQSADGGKTVFIDLDNGIVNIAPVAEIYKHISFDADGITIGSVENGISMNLDNDQLVFSKNGVEIVRLDIDNFTPTNVYIKSGGRLRLGNFAFEVDSGGVPSFVKVGG